MEEIASGLTSAFKEAGKTWKKMAGKQVNPSIELYDSLQDRDFGTLRSTYGLEKTSAYIRNMEAQKIMASRGGKG